MRRYGTKGWKWLRVRQACNPVSRDICDCLQLTRALKERDSYVPTSAAGDKV